MNPDSDNTTGRSTWRRALWVLAAIAGLAVLGYVGILVYANFINDPDEVLTAEDLIERLEEPSTTAASDAAGATTTTETTTETSAETSAETTTTAAEAADDGVDGRWEVADGTEVGYRVGEILFGVTTEGVGRTRDVSGHLVIEGTTITEATFEVDMATITSDDTRRDGQFRGRIMSVTDYPTATFTLTEPIELERLPAIDEQVVVTATGDLTLRGVTRPVTFDLTAQRTADRIGILGEIPIVFADFEIPNPSITGITTEDQGLLEFVVIAAR